MKTDIRTLPEEESRYWAENKKLRAMVKSMKSALEFYGDHTNFNRILEDIETYDQKRLGKRARDCLNYYKDDFSEILK